MIVRSFLFILICVVCELLFANYFSVYKIKSNQLKIQWLIYDYKDYLFVEGSKKTIKIRQQLATKIVFTIKQKCFIQCYINREENYVNFNYKNCVY